jgi:isopentenyldiphosphate isomerase
MESFQLVDRAGRPIGSATREACHGNPRLIHLVVHLHVFDPAGRLYLQKRGARKDTNPGRWDTSVGGHVNAGEKVPAALAREAQEELAIDASIARFLHAFLFESRFESEYAQCFSLTWTGAIHPNPDEIDEGRFFERREVEALLGTGALTPMFEREWPMPVAALYPEPAGDGPADSA